MWNFVSNFMLSLIVINLLEYDWLDLFHSTNYDQIRWETNPQSTNTQKLTSDSCLDWTKNPWIIILKKKPNKKKNSCVTVTVTRNGRSY